MDMEETTMKNTDILQAKSRLHSLHQMPVITHIVPEEGAFSENLLKTLQDKASVLEKLKGKE